jgi:serine/threonine-protein kinase
MTEFKSAAEHGTLAARYRCEEMIEQFEAAWQRGERPTIEALLPAAAADRRVLLVELVHAELECRLKAGEAARVEEYLQRFPELRDDRKAVVSLIAGEQAQRRRREPSLSLEDYLRQFPEYEEELLAAIGLEAPGTPATTGDTPPTSFSSLKDSGSPDATCGDISAPEAGRAANMRYIPLRLHARGGLGEVFLARDQELQREVALKRIRGPLADDVECRNRFLFEAEVTGRLEHPGIVPVLGLVWDEQGRPSYAMRFIEGDTLEQAIRRLHRSGTDGYGPADKSRALRHLLSRFVLVCNTVAYAHSRGILHRDLKPANILLGPFGETLVVDWGLAKDVHTPQPTVAAGLPDNSRQHGGNESTVAVAPRQSGTTPTISRLVTRDGQVIGTPGFMSPEQAVGDWDRVGPASDVYSLGATLYTLLTGETPFSGALDEVLEKVRRGEFVAPRRRCPDVPAALDAVCRKAMDLKPQNRYASALELAADLENWLSDEPVSARREPIAVRAGRWVRRHRVLVTTGVALLATATVFLAIIATVIERARQRSLHEEAQTAQQYERAERERLRAGTNLERALTAVDEMLTRLGDERVANLPEFDQDRHEILERALALYRQLLDQNPTEPQAQLETAKVQARLGDINVLLGQEAAALQAYDDSIRLLRLLTQTYPEHAEYAAALAHSEDQRGMTFWDSVDDPGSAAAARAAFEQAMPLWEQLVRDFPMNAEYLSPLAMDYHRMASLLSHANEAERSDALFRKAVDLQKQLGQTDAGDAKTREHMGSIYNSFAAHCLRTERWGEADNFARQALPLFDKLTAAYTRVPRYLYEQSFCWNIIGVVAAHGNRQTEAEKAYGKSMGILDNLLRTHPYLTHYQGEMADNLQDWGDIYEKKGWLSRAVVECQKALQWSEAMARSRPDNAGYASNLSLLCNRLGQLYASLRQPDSAASSFHRALEIRATQRPGRPTAAADQMALAEIHVNLGDLLCRETKTAEAKASYEKAAQILGTAPPDSTEGAIRSLRARLHLGLALVAIQSGQRGNADAHWQQALDLSDTGVRLGFRLAWARELARGSDPAQAMAEATAVGKEPNLTVLQRYDLAVIWALIAASSRTDQHLRDAERTRRGDTCALRAVEELTLLRAAGCFRPEACPQILQQDRDLDSLRSRPEFQKLLAAVRGGMEGQK